MTTVTFRFDVGDTVFVIRSSYDKCPHCKNGILFDTHRWGLEGSCKVLSLEFDHHDRRIRYAVAERHEGGVVGYRLETDMFATEREALAECERRNREKAV